MEKFLIRAKSFTRAVCRNLRKFKVPLEETTLLVFIALDIFILDTLG